MFAVGLDESVINSTLSLSPITPIAHRVYSKTGWRRIQSDWRYTCLALFRLPLRERQPAPIPSLLFFSLPPFPSKEERDTAKKKGKAALRQKKKGWQRQDLASVSLRLQVLYVLMLKNQA